VEADQGSRVRWGANEIRNLVKNKTNTPWAWGKKGRKNKRCQKSHVTQTRWTVGGLGKGPKASGEQLVRSPKQPAIAQNEWRSGGNAVENKKNKRGENEA